VPRKAQFFDKFLQDRLGVDAREFLSKNAMEQVDVRRMDAITIVDHHEMAQAQGVEAIPRPHHVSGVEGMNQVGVTPALQQAVKRAARGEKAIVLTLSQDGSPARVYGLDEYLGKRGCLSRDSHGDQDGWEVTTRGTGTTQMSCASCAWRGYAPFLKTLSRRAKSFRRPDCQNPCTHPSRGRRNRRRCCLQPYRSGLRMTASSTGQG
jgi:hypothetical protein